jgi:anti-anti-sigma factor
MSTTAFPLQDALFARRWLLPGAPHTEVVTAHGELDAANAQDFVDYALRHHADMDGLILDLSGVSFFGTAAFSALHTLNVRCAGVGVAWVLLPSTAVARLLRICDPDATLPICDSIDSGLSVLRDGPRSSLKLVPESG